MRIGLQQHSGSEAWAAGIAFIENMFLALRTQGSDCPTLVLVVDQDAPEQDYRGLASSADEVLRVQLNVPGVAQLKEWSLSYHAAWWLRTRLLKLPGPAQPNPLNEALAGARLDSFFSMAVTEAPLTSAPSVIWIPDFQHHHLPDNFTPEDRVGRDRIYLAQARHATRILVTSEEVRQDLQAFAPDQVGKARRISYVADVPAQIYEQNPLAALGSYHLPEKFIYLPNQFWRHKNHKLVFEALGQLSARGVRPCVVSTGSPFEYRQPALFSELMQMLSRLNIRDQVIILGLVPRDQVFALIRQSLCVLSASTFEGLGLSVAESKSVGKRVLVSDLAPFREQAAPGAVYFDPHNAGDLADKLEWAWTTLAAGPDLALEAAARAELPRRQAAFGRALLQLFLEAQADFSGAEHRATAGTARAGQPA